eukprot:2405759-Pleurochrysis_carterae.AAC.2
MTLEYDAQTRVDHLQSAMLPDCATALPPSNTGARQGEVCGKDEATPLSLSSNYDFRSASGKRDGVLPLPRAPRPRAALARPPGVKASACGLKASCV